MLSDPRTVAGDYEPDDLDLMDPDDDIDLLWEDEDYTPEPLPEVREDWQQSRYGSGEFDELWRDR